MAVSRSAFLYGLFLLFCICDIHKCENCVSEKQFNELKKAVFEQTRELKNENAELKQTLKHLESKMESYVNLKQDQELMAGKSRGKNEISAKEAPSAVAARKSRSFHKADGISKRYQSEIIAFYAYMSGSRCYGMHETFVFDVEETDVGKNFNIQDGIFDAPISGIYVFAVTVVPDYHKYVQAEIIINGSVRGRVFADSEEITDIHQSSTSIVVEVNAGDHVYVRRGNHSTCNVLSDVTHARTTFSGWMLN